MHLEENKAAWLDALLWKKGGDNQSVKELRLSLTYAAGCLIWAGIATASDILLENDMVAESWIWPVVMLPIFAAPLFFAAYYRFYTVMDELARKIQASSMITAFGATIFVLSTFMSLANVGVDEPGVNEVLAFMAVAYAFATAVQAIRYYR